MVKAKKAVIIDFIISELEKGFDRGKILVKAGKKWGTSKSAFDRYLKEAKNIHSERRQAIEKELLEIDKQAAIDARKKDIMGVEERKIILSKIARGTVKLRKWWVGKDYEVSKDVVPDYMDRKNAIAELNKMGGDYAPTKVAQTDTDGNNVKPPPSIFLSFPQGIDIDLPANTEE